MLRSALIVAVAAAAAALAVPPQESLETCQAERDVLAERLADLEARLASLGALPEQQLGERVEQPGSPGFLKNCVLAVTCVVMAALAAGLTMGLVSLEPMEMEIIVKSEEADLMGDKDKQKLKADQSAATRVLPLIKDHHRLLVTLLLMNSIANEALPLFLDKIVPSWMAVTLSVTLVLMFGEIIPSAIFTGSEQLQIAARFTPVVSAFRCLLAPVAWPIAKVLDCLLGKDHKGRYNFAELRAVVGIHARLHGDGEANMVAFKCHDKDGLGIITTETPHNFTDHSMVTFTGESTKLCSNGTSYFVEPCSPLRGRDSHHTFKLYTSEGRHASDLITFQHGELTAGHFSLRERDEIKIMRGVITLTHMTASEAMTPLSKAWMLEKDERLTCELLEKILDSGYSRIPVYCTNKHNLRGFILTKKLIVVTPKAEGTTAKTVESVGLDKLVTVPPSIGMLDLLNQFQDSKCHLALVTSDPERVRDAWDKNVPMPPDIHMSGIITLEDIIEKLLQEDIEDEHDAGKGAVTRTRTSSAKITRSVTMPAMKRRSWHATQLREPLLRMTP